MHHSIPSINHFIRSSINSSLHPLFLQLVQLAYFVDVGFVCSRPDGFHA